MGKSIGGFFSAVITGVIVAAAVYFSGGTALAAIGWGAASAAVSLVATSMLSQLGVQNYGDVADSLSRSTSPTTGLPVLYGGQLPHKNGISGGAFILVGSIVAWYNIPDGSSQYLFSEQAVCMAGVQKHIEQIYIDNEPVIAVPITSDGVVPKASIASKYRDILQLEVRFGGDYTTTKTLAKQYAGPKWTDKFLGKGVVSISVVIKKTQDSLENNLLVNDQFTLTAEMKGMEIYDFSTGTKFATSNPPSIIYDYLTNTEYGMGIEPALINTDTFYETAAYCNQMEYYANGSMSYSNTYKQNIEDVLQSFGGIIYVHAGQICMTTDRKTLSVASFDESNMFGQVQISTSGSTDYFNTIDAKYTNPLSMYTTDVLRIPSDISSDEAIRTDGQVITLSRDYSWVYDTDTLSRMVNNEVLKAKYSLRTITFTTSEGWDLKVWDAINVSNEELAINGKFKVLSKDVATKQDSVGYVTITAVEYPDAIFDGIDPGVWSPSGSMQFPALTVLPPTNLQVSRKGNISTGSVVTMSWTGSVDPNLRGYYVYYKLSTSNVWSYAGSTNKLKTDYEIFNLSDTGTYDFSVVAFNNIGLISQRLTLNGIIPGYNFLLPAITGLKLINSTESAYVTDQTDFNLRWDNQKALLVNGRSFTEYFKYYIVNIYNGNTLIDTFYTQDSSFNYTFVLNSRKIRKPTIGIIAQGYLSSTYSQEVKITVENKQMPLVQGVTISGGFGNLFVSWTPNELPDYAGAEFVITSGNTVRTFISNKPAFDSVPNIVDGTYKVKMGLFDMFGTDGIQYSTEQTIQINSRYQFTADDAVQIESVINLQNKLDTTLSSAVNQSTAYTNTRVDTLKNTVDGNAAKITTLNQTVVDNNSAQTQAITQLKASTDNQIAGVNQQMTAKADKSTVDASYTLSANANGVVSGIRLVASQGTVNNSAIYFVADKLLVAPSAGATVGAVAPFAIVGNTTYLNNAVIQSGSIGTAYIADGSILNSKIANASINSAKIIDGEITNAKIGQYIQSNNYVPNSTGWLMDKAGNLYINGAGGTGRMTISNNLIQIFDNNGTLRVRMGLW